MRDVDTLIPVESFKLRTVRWKLIADEGFVVNKRYKDVGW